MNVAATVTARAVFDELEAHNITYFTAHSAEFFGKKMSEETITDAKYKSLFSWSKNKDKTINTTYPPKVKVKLPFDKDGKHYLNLC